LDEVIRGDVLVRDVMSTPLIYVYAFHSVREAAAIMVEKGVGSVVVLDEAGMLMGIMTRTDILKHVVAKGLNPDNVKVSDIMTRNPLYVLADTPLEEAARLMGSRGVGHLPVLDPKTFKPIGMISKRDVLRIAPHYITMVYALRIESASSQSREF
jgi:Predicted signal-transduction protein containing cAMP-binding and CBS domains